MFYLLNFRIAVVMLITAMLLGLSACGGEAGKRTTTQIGGQPDTSFGVDGMVLLDSYAGATVEAYINSIAEDDQGRIVLGGQAQTGGLGKEAVVGRLLEDGSIDTSFNSTGYHIRNGDAGNAGGNDQVFAVSLDSAGNILATGYGYGSWHSTLTWRFTSEGLLDTTFNIGSGVIMTSLSATDDFGIAILQQADGKVLVGGSKVGTDENSYIMRLAADGTIENPMVFNGASYFWSMPTPLSGRDEITSLAVDDAGRIYGSGFSLGDASLLLVRLNQDGTIDTTFATNGILLTKSGAATAAAYKMTLDKQGRILLAGRIGDPGMEDMAVWRFLSDGSPDTSFGAGAGYVSFDLNNNTSWQQAVTIALDAQGRILVGGNIHDTVKTDIALLRLNADGTLDNTFNNTGYVWIDTTPEGEAGNNDNLKSMFIDARGRIVLGGQSDLGTLAQDMILWRFLP
ncbi:MAG: hypothetical protein OEZ59_11630 [Deltaproteobacteria bacterium]|nr:hypothetical protein [Deltaproteobacteria bacterium]